MEERTTFTPDPPRPIVLVAGCRGALLCCCREAAGRIGVDLEAAEILALAGLAASRRPLAVLLSVDLYCFDPEEFDALALSVGAQRLLVEDGERVDRLTARLREAVKCATADRARDSLRPGGIRSAPEPPPGGAVRHSGIRWKTASRPEAVPSSGRRTA